MKKQFIYFLVGLTIILLSTPLGYKVINIVYYNKNLTNEYVPILNGFIYSFMLIGALVFSIGLISTITNKKS